MDTESECAGHATSKVEQKRALVQRFSADVDVTVEIITTSQYEFHEAESNLIVREPCSKQVQDEMEAAEMLRSEKSEKRFTFEILRHKAGNCSKNKIHGRTEEDTGNGPDNRVCYKSEKKSHIARLVKGIKTIVTNPKIFQKQ